MATLRHNAPVAGNLGVLAFGLSVCRPHLMPPGAVMPSIFWSSFHAVLPFQTKNAGAPHSPQVHLQAKQTPLTLPECSPTPRYAGSPKR